MALSFTGDLATDDAARPLAAAESAPCFISPIEAASRALLDPLLAHGWQPPVGLAALDRSVASDVVAQVAVVTRAARVLGEWWVADTCSFADVTLGLHRLTLLLIAIENRPDPARVALHGGTVLLALAPGDQHGFGLATVGLALRRAGWDVTVELGGSAEAIVRRVAARAFDCVGVSVGHDRAMIAAAELVARIRRGSRRPDVTVAAGGPMLARDPDLAARIGADFGAADGFALADRLWSLRPARAA